MKVVGGFWMKSSRNDDYLVKLTRSYEVGIHERFNVH